MPTPTDLSSLLRLWSEPDPDDDALLARFASWYADPTVVNGVALRPTDLLARARALQRGLSDQRHEVVEKVVSGDEVVLAFVLHGRHTGLLATPLGELAPTGRTVEVRVVDVLHLTGGRVSEITMVADELGMLTQLGALASG